MEAITHYGYVPLIFAVVYAIDLLIFTYFFDKEENLLSEPVVVYLIKTIVAIIFWPVPMLYGGTSMIHELKIWPNEYSAVVRGHKRFEFRECTDRTFKINDRLKLQEWDPKLEKYTGKYCMVRVTYVLRNSFGLPDDYCIMSINTIA